VTPLALAQIKHIDAPTRTLRVTLEDGRELSVTLPPEANIEVSEPCTLGTMGGTLEDLKIGYWIDAVLADPGAASCSCHSLVCIS
jgi:hypothetical protein